MTTQGDPSAGRSATPRAPEPEPAPPEAGSAAASPADSTEPSASTGSADDNAPATPEAGSAAPADPQPAAPDAVPPPANSTKQRGPGKPRGRGKSTGDAAPTEPPSPATEAPDEPGTGEPETGRPTDDATGEGPSETPEPTAGAITKSDDPPGPASPAAVRADEPATDSDSAATDAAPAAIRAGTGVAAAPDAAADSDTAAPDAATEPEDGLIGALGRLRVAIAATAYPLVLPSTEDARRIAAALVGQLDDYLLPRLARLDAPLLVVVGGSTGAGKSTLVNSLVRAPVSVAGVLRPTTRAPVLVCHPDDNPWFRQGDLLPGLTRTAKASSDPHTLQLVSAPGLTPGLAFLDAPDIDSVVDANRALAAQLLAAADLWLFVTTAARYADAVPWELLRTARLRGTVTALVLDRVPDEGADEISDHLRQMLAVHNLDSAPLFVLPETALDGQGLLSEQLIAPLRAWFSMLAADSTARSSVVRQTLDGALAALVPAVEGLAAAADAQAAAANTLAERVTAAHRSARAMVEHGVRDGTLLRGEVLARWQEFVGTGELLRTLEARIGRLRDRVVAAVSGRPTPGRQLENALESNLVTLIRGAAADAAEQAYTGWQAHPAGAALLAPGLARPADDLPERAERLVRDWQRGVLELVRTEGGDRRFVARTAAYGVNATGLAVMLAVFVSTAGLTGLEIVAAGGTTVAAQKVLEAIFGDQAIRTLAGKARTDLLSRVDALLDAEAERFLVLLEPAGAHADRGADLRAASEAVERERSRAHLTSGTGPDLPAQADVRPSRPGGAAS